MVMVIIIAFSDHSKAYYNRVKKSDLKTPEGGYNKFRYNVGEKSATQHPSRNTTVMIAYLIMLIIRFIAELIFLNLELQLNRNQTQNADFFDTLVLKKYYCYTFNDH